jgi:hypothetical protein
MVLEVQYPNKSILVSNIYRSPNPPPNISVSDHIDLFLDTLDTHLARLSDLDKNSYIFTDSNINLLKLNEGALGTDYMDTLITNGYLQIISKATRVQNNNVSLIDHIMTNTNLKKYNAGTIIDDMSDHFMNFVQISHEKNTKKDIKEETKRLINEANTNNLKLALNNTDWTPVLVNTDTDSSFNCFWDIFSALYTEHFPLTNVKFNKNKHRINGYMSNELLDSRSLKLSLQKKSLRTKDPVDIAAYITQRNVYNSMLRKCKQKYYKDNLMKNVKNSKRSWELLKEAANLNKTSPNVEKLEKDGLSISDPTEIANEFNEFFTNIGVKISESVVPTVKTAEDYMPALNDIQQLDLGTTSQVHVCDIIKSLKPKGSCDVDGGISTKLLKTLAIELSWPLAHIFRLSLQNGIFPSKLKKSRVVPIFKAGNTYSCDNYRPISLLSTLSKVLEKMVSVQLVNHLDRNNILYEHQYGFQRNKSTEHSLVHAINFIGKAMNDNNYCIGVFFDLKKAFDVCSHEILVMKLSKMGVSGVALDWFKSYLSDRYQCVDINGNLSDSKRIKISILQGSILGPILFLCFINDLFLVTTLLTLMFADDTFSLKSSSDLKSLCDEVNSEINKMAVWFRANKLAVNINKTKYMIFRMKGKKIDQTVNIFYNENEPDIAVDPNLITELERYHDQHENKECRTYKLLGINLDEFLTLDAHTTYIVSKLSRSLYCIKQAKHIIPPGGLKALYFALIHSHLTYCTAIMSILNKKNRTKIFKIQKKAVRIMTNSGYNAHTNPIFQRHLILPFDLLIQQGQLSFMHAINNNYAPKSFATTWLKNRDRDPNITLRNANDYHLVQPRTETFKRTTLYALPATWNDLSPYIKLQNNRITFRWALKAHLLESLFE